MSKTTDKALAWIEYALSAMFLYAGVNTAFVHAVSTSVFYAILVGQAAIYVYAFIFFALGVTLIYSKIKKNKKLHGLSLLIMYLTCLYVALLSFGISGVSASVIPSIVTGLVSAALWLRWKSRTEYINPKEFDALRNSIDKPPDLW